MAISKEIPTSNATTEDGVTCHPDQRAFWVGIGLPYCEKCCNPRATDLTGKTICRIEQPETCPLILQEG